MKPRLWIALACWVSAALAHAAAPLVSDPIVPADPVAAGQELAARLRSLRPGDGFTNSATLRDFARRKLLREAPLEIIVSVGSTHWSTTYRLNPGATNQTELCVIRRQEDRTEYLLRPPGQGSANEPVSPDAGLMIPFGDSEFWLADLGMEFLHWPTQRLLRKEICRGQSCDKLESLAPAGQTNGYTRVVAWFDVDTGGPVLVEAYDAAGRMVKEFKPNQFKKVDGQWEVEEVEISNPRTRKRSTIQFHLPSRQGRP